jgi:anaerobic magnesium-protoporphyrin IX monomethyl ester cyclase
MKLFMIYPNMTMTTRAPLGIGYLSSYLKDAGHQFKLFDTTFIKCGDAPGDDALREKNLQVSNPDLNKLGLVERDVNVFEELAKELLEFQPNLIGMSTVDPNHAFGVGLLNHCRAIYPEVPIIVGGPLATLVPDEIIADECIDMIAIGEAEESLVELCNNLEIKDWSSVQKTKNIWVKDHDYLNNGLVHKNIAPLPDIEHGLAPDLSIFDKRHFVRPLAGKMYRMATVVWTRGCVFHCSYCANETFYKAANASPKQYYRKKDVSALVDELQNQKESYNLNFFQFVDDIWPMHDPELIQDFCEKYRKYVDIPFGVTLQCKLIKEEAFSLAVDAGLRNICVGLESGSPRIRKEVLKRNYKDEDVVRAFSFAHKYKIRSSSFNIIGLPHETRDDIFQTIELNRRAKPNSATVTFFHPYRGAPLRELCVTEGLIEETDSKHEDMYRSESQLNLPQITKKELSGLMQTFQLYVKLPKELWPEIKASEDLSTDEARRIRDDILLPAFFEIQSQEPQFDFTKKTSWWKGSFVDENNSVPQELYPGFNAPEAIGEGETLPATLPGDAGFYPIENLDDDHEPEWVKEENRLLKII